MTTDSRDELPLPDYDHMPLGTLESHIHALDERGVMAVLAYEREHADRLPVVQMLERRIDALRGGEQPSGSLPDDVPEMSETRHGSKVSPDTAGPEITPARGRYPPKPKSGQAGDNG